MKGTSGKGNRTCKSCNMKSSEENTPFWVEAEFQEKRPWDETCKNESKWIVLVTYIFWKNFGFAFIFFFGGNKIKMLNIIPYHFISGIIWTDRLTNIFQYYKMFHDIFYVKWCWMLLYKWYHKQLVFPHQWQMMRK